MRASSPSSEEEGPAQVAEAPPRRPPPPPPSRGVDAQLKQKVDFTKSGTVGVALAGLVLEGGTLIQLVSRAAPGHPPWPGPPNAWAGKRCWVLIPTHTRPLQAAKPVKEWAESGGVEQLQHDLQKEAKREWEALQVGGATVEGGGAACRTCRRPTPWSHHLCCLIPLPSPFLVFLCIF